MQQEPILFTLPGPWRIPIEVNASVLMLLLIFMGLSAGSDPLIGLMFFAVILISILLHELGHAWACVVQRVQVRRVVLHGGGGFCEHAGRSSAQQQEFITIMGPIVNLAIWAISTLLIPMVGDPVPDPIVIDGFAITPPYMPNEAQRLLTIIAQVNLFLAIFNMMPIFPLDGGRLLNVWLQRFMRGYQANRISGLVGVVMSVLWIPLMFVAFYTFGFILLFLPPLVFHWRMMRTGSG